MKTNEQLFQRFKASPVVQQAIAESDQIDADEREAVIAERSGLQTSIAEASGRHAEIVAAADREVIRAETALEAARLEAQRVRQAQRAEVGALEIQAGRLEHILRGLLPEYATEAVARLIEEEDRLVEESSSVARTVPSPPVELGVRNLTRDYAPTMRAFSDRIRLLRSVRNELGDLHILPVDELGLRLQRIDGVLAGEMTV